MDILSYKTLFALRSVAIYPEMRQLLIYLEENKTAMSSYYKKTNYFIKNNHPFVKLFTRLYEFFGESPEQTYYNVLFNLTSIASAFRLTNINPNQEPQSVFSGVDIIVLDDTAFKVTIPPTSWVGGQLVGWNTLNGIKLTYHEESDFTPTLFLDTLTETASKSIGYLDLPLLATQLHHFTLQGQTQEVAPGINDFLISYLYLPLYENVMNWHFFNRLLYTISFDPGRVDLLPTENVRSSPSFFYFEINEYANRVIRRIASNLSRLGTWDIGKVFANIPLPYSEDARSLLPPLSAYYTDTLQWVEMCSQMLLYKHYLKVGELLLVDTTNDKLRRTIPLKLTQGRIRNLSAQVPTTLQEWVSNTLQLDTVR